MMKSFSSTIYFYKYVVLIIAAVLFNINCSLAAAPMLSPSAEISLLSCASGPALYKTFGHSAVRVKDPLLNIDRVYNYGTFDFNTDNFYLKFARGKLNYWLSVSSFENFFLEYAYFKQTVYENEFNFTQEEKQQMFDFLENNYLPANRFYLYDFFFDNCATRIRDAVYVTFENQISIADSSWHKRITFREALDLYVTNQPWSHFGMDLGLGIPTDTEMDINQIMFLPEYLMLGMENMVMQTEDGIKPLLKPRIMLFEGSTFGTDAGEVNYLFVLFMIIAIVVLYFTFKELKNRKHSFKFDNLVFLFPAIIAVVQLLLWFATDHRAAKINPDLLWSLPPLILILISKKKALTKNSFSTGLVIAIFMSIFYLILWLVFKINYNLLIFPFIIMVMTRIFKLYTLTIKHKEKYQTSLK